MADWLAGSCGNQEDWIEMLTCRKVSQRAAQRVRGVGEVWGAVFRAPFDGCREEHKVKLQQKCLDTVISTFSTRPPRPHLQKIPLLSPPTPAARRSGHRRVTSQPAFQSIRQASV